MASFRIVGMAAALALLAAGPGGCPLAEGLPEDIAPSAEVGPTAPAGAGVDEDADVPSERTTTLEELVSGIMEGDGGEELAWSYGSTWVYTGPDYNPEGVYPPGYNPYGQGATGGAAGGGGESGPSGGSDGSGGGGSDDGESEQTSGSGSPTYSGTVDCFRHESLEGYGEMSEEMTFQVTMSFDEQGVPNSVPFPLFIERIIVYPDVRQVGETDTFTVPFTSTATWNVTVTVVSATYTPQSASVVLEIDLGWVGEHSSVTASGVHTLEAQIVEGALSYSSDTHYEAEFRAADDWLGWGTEDFDCSGMLTPD
ncbi:MAG: hypothetical protein ACE5I3_04335 [Phycisphaerae bacterium]